MFRVSSLYVAGGGGCGGVCMQKDSARGGTYYVVAQTLPLLMSRQLHEWSGEEVCAKESL